MSAEERRLADLKIVYAQYRALFEQKTLEYLTQRLLSLISELAKAVSSPNLQKVHSTDSDHAELSALRGLYRDLIETIPALNELSSAMDILSASIYEGWRDIQLIRRSNSDIRNTGARLIVRKVNSNLTAPGQGTNEQFHDPGQFWATFQASLLDTPRLLEEAQRIIFQDNVKIARIDDEAVLLNPQDSPRGSEFSAPQLALKASDEQLNKQIALARIVSAIKEFVQTLVDSNGLIPQYALRLTEDCAITPDNQLPALEAKRRAYLRNTRLKAVLKVNGTTVTATEYRPLSTPSMSCEFNQFFEFKIFHQPREISFDLYSGRTDSWAGSDIFLATVAIPFPGQYHRPNFSGPQFAAKSNHKVVTHSYIPTSGWYSFSSVGVSSVHKRAMRDMGYTDEELTMPRRTEVADTML